MNIFQKLGFINRGLKAVKEINKLRENNSNTVKEIMTIISDLIKLLERLKLIVPDFVADFVTELITIIKKWLKK